MGYFIGIGVSPASGIICGSEFKCGGSAGLLTFSEFKDGSAAFANELELEEEKDFGAGKDIILELLAHTNVMNNIDTETKKECLNPFTDTFVIDYKFFNASFIKRSTGTSGLSCSTLSTAFSEAFFAKPSVSK